MKETMKPRKAWAIRIKGDDWAIEDTRQDARDVAKAWHVYDGRECRVVRVEVREIPSKGAR